MAAFFKASSHWWLKFSLWNDFHQSWIFLVSAVFTFADGSATHHQLCKLTVHILGQQRGLACRKEQWRWREFMVHFGGRLEGASDWLNVGGGSRQEWVPGSWHEHVVWMENHWLGQARWGRSRTKAEFRSGCVKNSNSKRYTHPSVHGSTIHNSQDMETA